LVDRAEVDLVGGVEGVLRSIPMMHVPIENEDALQAAGQRLRRRDCDAV
jgi:hypothetical protein